VLQRLSSPHLRLALLFGGLLLLIGVGLWKVERASDRALRAWQADQRDERARLFERAVFLQGAGLETLTGSYAWWADMVKFVENPNLEWAKDNVDNLAGAPNSCDAFWILDETGQLLHTIDANFGRPEVPYASFAELAGYLDGQYQFNYFTVRNGEVWQIFGAAIQDPNFWRHQTPVRGYLLLGKRWDETWVARLGDLTQTRLRILPRPEPPSVPERGFSRTLIGIGRQPVAHVVGTVDLSVADALQDMLRHQQILVLAGFLLLVALSIGGFITVILRPLTLILRSLESRNPAPLGDLIHARSQLGEIARMIASQFRQGRMLQEEIRRQVDTQSPENSRREQEALADLRLRLASDLHDGPMQAIYAAGLRLAALNRRLRDKDPAAAEELTGVSQVLGECTANLRNLLFDLEPEELRDHELEGALERLERYLKSVIPAFELEIDDHSLDGIQRDAQLQLFYICRELVSNAIRHARPSQARLALVRRDGFLRLDWTNDGVLNLSPTITPGNGLRNIAQRVDQLDGSFVHRLRRDLVWTVTIELPYTSLVGP